jgi:DNA-binding MarR family transcriptional regulator
MVRVARPLDHRNYIDVANPREISLPAKPVSPGSSAALQGIRLLISALSQSARGVEQTTGITNAQLFLLREVVAGDVLTINELAARAHTGQNTVSTVVTHLEKRKLVTRGRANADGRVVTVTATAAGRRLLQRAPEPVTGRLLDVLSKLPARELRTVVRALTLLNDGLGLDGGPDTTMLFEADGAGSLGGARRRTTRKPKR